MNRKTPSPTRRTQALFAGLGKICQRIPSGAQPEAVHHLRTTIRRIETLAAQFEQDAGLKKLLKQLARLRKRASKVRDLDVQVVALRTVMLESAVADKRLVMRALNRARAKAEGKLIAAVQDAIDSGLADKLQWVRKDLSASAVAVIAKDHAGAALAKFADTARNYPTLTRDNLHEFRMECKRIRYLAEIGDTALGERVVNECKRIQDAVGEWHDWLTLNEKAEKVLPDRNSPLLHVLRMRERSKFAAAMQVAGQSRQILLSMGAPAKGPRAVRSAEANIAAAG